MARVVSVNVGAVTASPDGAGGRTGIDKRPVAHSVQVRDPGPKGMGASGLVGDTVVDLRDHGGSDQAVYAYAREDLEAWERELGRALDCGAFGENLTVEGLDVTGARIGERWRVGGELVLEVADPRIPCRTFARFVGAQDWVRRFTRRGAPGAYLRVIAPGPVQAGDRVEVCDRPDHEVTVALVFRALTTAPERLPELLAAGDALTRETRAKVASYTAGSRAKAP